MVRQVPRKFSVFRDRPALQKEIPGADVQLQVNQGLELNFTANPGAMKQVVSLTGPPPSVPGWRFGCWWTPDGSRTAAPRVA
jgi:hypothetical protein